PHRGGGRRHARRPAAPDPLPGGGAPRRRQDLRPRGRPSRLGAGSGVAMYLLIRREDVDLAAGPPAHSSGLSRALLIGGHTGATHTGLALIELADGHVDSHVHSFETSFYVLEGEPVLYLDGRGVR